MSNEQIKENLRPMSPEPFDPKKRLSYAERAVQKDDSDYEEYERVLEVKFKDWQGLKILDIGGTPNGNFARSAKDLGIDLITYNPIKNPSQQTLKNSNILQLNRSGRIAVLDPDSAPNTVFGLAQQMPFKSNSFDKIIGLASIPVYLPNNINEYKETFNELIRVLKSGGECLLNPVIENIYNSALFKKLLDDLKTQAKINFSDPYEIKIFRSGEEIIFNCARMQILKF